LLLDAAAAKMFPTPQAAPPVPRSVSRAAEVPRFRPYLLTPCTSPFTEKGQHDFDRVLLRAAKPAKTRIKIKNERP